MLRSCIAHMALFLTLFTLFGCGAIDEPSPISLEAIASTIPMRSIGPGVSEGEYADQRIVHVKSQQGADWLFDNSFQQYNSISERYAQTHDASLLARMNILQSTLQLTSERIAGPLLMTYALEPEATEILFCPTPNPCCNDCMCSCTTGQSGPSCTCTVSEVN